MIAFVLSIVPATDVRKSGAVFLPRHAKGILVHVPSLEAGGNVAKLEVSCGAAIQFNDFGNAALVATYDTDWVLMDTNLNTGGGAVSSVGATWPLGGQWVRCVADADQTASRVFRIMCVEDR